MAKRRKRPRQTRRPRAAFKAIESRSISREIPVDGGPVVFLTRRLTGRLDRMFDDPGLTLLRTSSPNHPVIEQYDRLLEFQLARGAVAFSRDEEIVRDIAVLVMDLEALPHTEGEDFWSFLPNDADRQFFIDRLPNPTQYEDASVELVVWNHLSIRGIDCQLIESDSFPDIVIGKGSPNEIYVEAKHLRVTSGLRRVGEVLKKANQQIRHASAGKSGVVYLKVEQDLADAGSEGDTPSQVQAILTEVERVLRGGQNRSVASVVCFWDRMGIEDHAGGAAFRVQRTSRIIEHPTPHAAIGMQTSELLINKRIDVSSRHVHADAPPNLPAIVRHDVRLSEGFRKELHKHGVVRPAHVLDALRNPTAREIRESGDRRFILVTKRIESRTGPFTLLVIAHQKVGELVDADEAFRLYDRNEFDSDLAGSPYDAFMEALRRFGYPIALQPGGPFALWIPYTKVVGDPGVFVPDNGDPSRSVSVRCGFKPVDLDATPPVFEVHSVYGIDHKRYAADIES